MVGNLIGRQAEGFQRLLRLLVERSGAAFVGQNDFAARMTRVEGGTGLDRELVERQVVAGVIECPAELVPPGRRRLPGPGVDPVEGEAEIGRASCRERVCQYV